MKLSDLATCSPASSNRLELGDVEAAKKYAAGADLPPKETAKNSGIIQPMMSEQATAEPGDQFTKIRRVSLFRAADSLSRCFTSINIS